MAFEHGKVTVFKIDNSSNSLTNISTYTNNVDFGADVDVPETTTFGVDDRTYIIGLIGHTFSVSGLWESAVLDLTLAGIVGHATSKSFEYGPQGSATGDVKYTGECFMSNYSISSPVDGVSSWTADFTITAAVTRGTY